MRRLSALVVLLAVGCKPVPAAKALEPAPRTEQPAPSPAPTSTVAGPAGSVEDPSSAPDPGACDEYLALYQTCEPRLEPEIQAGDRRTYVAEKGWIEYMRGTPEGAQLDEGCRELLRELERDCGPAAT